MSRCLRIALLALFPVLAGAQGTRTALVIGNAKYESAVGPLRNSVNDAKAVAKLLRGLGFSVVEEHNVTRDDLLEAVADFRKKTTGAEVALFYFAGHGISVGGSNYLIPVKSGYDPQNADETTLRLLAETKLFNAEQAVAEMSASGARCNLVILDACRNTPVARTPRTRDATASGGLSEMQPPAGSLIAFSTDAGRIAHDGDGANGLYTEELLKHMRTPGLTIEQVFKRTRAGVLERSGGAQIPAEYSRLIGEDIFLAGAASLPPPPAPPMKAEPAAAPTLAEITKLAAAGKAAECVTALQQTAASRGAGDFASAPLETLLERAKDDLKDATAPSPKVENAMKTCELVLTALRECLPPDHTQKAALTAKAQNRRGDALLLFGRADEALDAYNAALPLAPDDAYIQFNRGRALQALGDDAGARADFEAVVKSRTAKPGAKKLAQEALTAMKGA
ncbi:MAG: caspase family protein [Verrucomicrobiaceae bacterium]|nr:caspase family protein [Verrucomicrobiaceae bacterium]